VKGYTINGITPQNLVESRNAATRPAAVNGLGLTPIQAEVLSSQFEADFPLLEETPDIYRAWKMLVNASGAIGKRVHDARLVAVCHVHRIRHILTFNVSHFAGLASLAPGIIVLDPMTV
jgi:hypothetical protein